MPKANQGTAPLVTDEPAEMEPVVDATPIEGLDDLDSTGPVNFESLTSSAPATIDEPDYGSSLVLPTSGGFGFDDKPVFDSTEVEINRLKLLQGQSPELTQNIQNARPGYWFLQGQDEALEEVTFFPVGMMRNREYRPKNADGSMGHVLCRSNDGQVGIGKPGGACQACPLAQWGERNEVTGKGTPPACSQIWLYMGVLLEAEEVCVVSFQKTSTKAAKWLNAIAARKDGFGSFAVRFGSKLEKSGKAQWFVPTYTVAQVPEATLQSARDLLG
jgi:hypothetical protein